MDSNLDSAGVLLNFPGVWDLVEDGLSILFSRQGFQV